MRGPRARAAASAAAPSAIATAPATTVSSTSEPVLGSPLVLAFAALALGCTALAYLLFFRLIARIGAPRTMTVSFLIPLFGVLWGWLFLGETIGAAMLAGCGVILAGTALSTGLVDTLLNRRRGPRAGKEPARLAAA